MPINQLIARGMPQYNQAEAEMAKMNMMRQAFQMGQGMFQNEQNTLRTKLLEEDLKLKRSEEERRGFKEKREQEEWDIKKKSVPIQQHLQALDMLVKNAPDINYGNYSQWRQRAISAGLFPDSLPEEATLNSEAIRNGVPPDQFFEMRKKQFTFQAQHVLNQALVMGKAVEPIGTGGSINLVTGQVIPPINKPEEPYKIGHIMAFNMPGGSTEYREYKGNGKWEIVQGTGKSEKDTYDTWQEALKVAKEMYNASDKDVKEGMIPVPEQTADGKWRAALKPNIMVRIPAAGNVPNLPPDVFRDRRTGELKRYNSDTGKIEPYKPEEGVSAASLEWQSVKKSLMTSNSPTFQRIAKNAEILVDGVYDPKTKKWSEPELDKIVRLRDEVEDGVFGNISNNVRMFNSWDQFVNYQVSDPAMAKLKSAITANVERLGAVYAGGGTVTSDMKLKLAMELLDAKLSKKGFAGLVDIHKESLKNTANKYRQSEPSGIGGGKTPPPTKSQERKQLNGKWYIKQNDKWFEE